MEASMKKTYEDSLDALALYKAWETDPAGYVLAVGKAAPESLRAMVTGMMVIAKMLAQMPDGQDVTEFLDRYEFELRRELDEEPGQ